MKFPSIYSVVKGARQTFFRFPLAILLAVVGTRYCIRILYLDDDNQSHYWIRNIIATAYLGMLLSVALTVIAEKRKLGRGMRLGLQGAVVALAVLYYLSLPDHFTVQALIRFILYALGLHWLIACIAFSGREDNGFWVYNKRLFLRILTSALYTTVLYVGLMLALLAIEHLFNVSVDSKLYVYTWFVLVGVFNTWFFLSGFPADYESPVVIADYPKGLKIFTQFVLLPILTVYLLILYAYLFRIIFTATMPYEWVTYLVLGFSVAGILAMLLVWPLSEGENNKWISGYSRFFYFALFPLIVMLLIAVLQRVGKYGITELRYFVLLLALWLLFIALYFLLSRRKSIRLIPLSLCVAAFLVSFGPWGSAAVSLYSQQHRLKALLEKDKILVGGRIGGAAEPVSLKDRKEITDITNYIVEVHGYGVLQPWFRENLDSLMKSRVYRGYYNNHSSYDESEALLKVMKVKSANRWATEDSRDVESEEENFAVNIDENDSKVLGIKGYDFFIHLHVTVKNNSNTEFEIDKAAFHCRLDSADNRLTLMAGKDAALLVDLSPVLTTAGFEQRVASYTLPLEKMTLDAGNSQWAGRVVLQRFDGILREGKKHITLLNGYLLLKRR